MALLASGLVAGSASAVHPFAGAPIVYVGVEDQFVPEEGFVGVRPIGLRSLSIGASDIEPSFTPSGKRVLFVRLGGDKTVVGSSQGDVLSIRTDGQELRRITSTRAADRSPAMSPNGRQIVFSREPIVRRSAGDPEWGRRHIYSIRADGSRIRDLTPRIRARHGRGERNFEAEDPAFSPNGRTIAFTLSANTWQNIYTMRPDGSRARSLTGVGPHPLSRRFKLSEPAFSPSGRFLLVTARERYRRTELAVIDLADRSDLLGTGSAVEGEAPAWMSPRPHPE